MKRSYSHTLEKKLNWLWILFSFGPVPRTREIIIAHRLHGDETVLFGERANRGQAEEQLIEERQLPNDHTHGS